MLPSSRYNLRNRTRPNSSNGSIQSDHITQNGKTFLNNGVKYSNPSSPLSLSRPHSHLPLDEKQKAMISGLDDQEQNSDNKKIELSSLPKSCIDIHHQIEHSLIQTNDRTDYLDPMNVHSPETLNHQLFIKEDIQSLVLWRRPIQTIYHALHNIIELLNNWYILIIHHISLCLSVAIFLLIFFLLLQVEGSHKPYIQFLYKRLAWCFYWCGLGILSSVGLGTGLHTFILYLGPHIASVTLAAYECNSLYFPEPPYPDEIICPNGETTHESINVWSIMSKVRLEAFMWGAGTALGELPPYFISRAHRLAVHQGVEPQQDDILEGLEEIEDLVPEATNTNNQGQQELIRTADRHHSIVQTLKTKMILLMKRMGFFGILACASIPNPLFDLAGIICGYSLISFWTFFGATLVGKAIIKMHIQKLVVIIVFNETYVQSVLAFCKNIPYIGHYVHDPLRDYLQQQKKSLHRGTNQMMETKSQSWISFIFESFVIVMVTYFMVSIINSMAQSDLKQYYQNQIKKSFPNKNTKNNKQTIEQTSLTNVQSNECKSSSSSSNNN